MTLLIYFLVFAGFSPTFCEMETVTWTRSRLSRSSGKHIWRISDFRLLLTAFSRPENENRIDSPPFKIGANQDEFFLSIQALIYKILIKNVQKTYFYSLENEMEVI